MTDVPVGVSKTFRELEDRDVTQFALDAFLTSVNVVILRYARTNCKH